MGHNNNNFKYAKNSVPFCVFTYIYKSAETAVTKKQHASHRVDGFPFENSKSQRTAIFSRECLQKLI